MSAGKPKGLSKSGGRQKGSQNLITKDVREAFKKLLEGNLENMTGWISDVAKTDPHKAFSMMISLAEYVIPKLNRVEHAGKVGREMLPPIINVIGPKDREYD